MIQVRPAEPRDAGPMCEVLNAIIARGGTTAHQRPFSPERMLHHYVAPPANIACSVAEGQGLLGFQSLVWADDPEDPMPPGWAIIATFARPGMTRQGIGSALFRVTLEAARKAGVATIDATIRADNAGGLAYYSRMGFTDYDRLIAVPLRDGTPVDRVRKRLDVTPAPANP